VNAIAGKLQFKICQDLSDSMILMFLFLCMPAIHWTGRGAKYCDEYVCLSAHKTWKPHT